MYVLAESDYRSTHWYERILTPLKAEARRKRIALFECESIDLLPAEESSVFLLGGSERWIYETVRSLQARSCHPILLNEVDDGCVSGRLSRVRSDYGSLAARLCRGGARCAFYGVNPASASDLSRRAAFLCVNPMGEVFENRGSLADCFERFFERHRSLPFDTVLCTNDFAAASLLCHLRERQDVGSVSVVTQASGALLSYFPTVRTARLSPDAVAAAAFEIFDCQRAHPDFLGVQVSLELSLPEEGTLYERIGDAREDFPSEQFYRDPEMSELLRLERLLSSLDETDRKILTLIERDACDIGEEAFLSDNGVKYRIKKMKRLCGVESKREIPPLLEKYGIRL